MSQPVVRKSGGPKPYEPALGPALKVLLIITFGAVAILGATAAYTGAVKLLDWWSAPHSYSTVFTVWMFLSHGGLGAILFVPFVLFGLWHFATAFRRSNKAAIRRGLYTFALGLIIGGTGFALFQVEGLPQLPTDSVQRLVVYWLHVVIPFAAVWAYVSHRKAGPRIKWGIAKWWGAGVALFVGGMLVMHSQSPHRWYAEGPKEGEQYFHPSEARTADGKFIPAESLMSDQYCMRCHKDIFDDHLHSAHKFSSFNNPAYLFSVKETREDGIKKVGSVKSSRWCAGCPDPVPFFSGAFDDPNFDMEKHPTAHAGITCVTCHSMTHIHGPTGNAAYTIEAPDHYPWAFSYNEQLRALSDQLVKAKPDVHKKTFLKPFHKTAEFCSTCHKVALPVELNHYKDFLRGQNHYDSYLLSGASGVGARSFYYPPKAFDNCAACHMPEKPVTDPNVNFAGRIDPATGQRTQKNHLFLGANTGLPTLLKNDPRFTHLSPGFDKMIDAHEKFLKGTDPEGKDKKLRIDIFGLKEGGTGPDKLIAPLRPNLPKLKPGQTYVVEVVIRTLLIGHPFTQGTVDSNEVWVDFKATAGGKEIARNGALRDGANGPLDEWSHIMNVHMLDRNGNRINRRNPQDIFVPLYDKQIPPGAAQIAHYRLDVPKDVTGPIELHVKLRYRKFDFEYMTLVHKDKPVPALPIVDVCEDKLTLPVEGGPDVAKQESPIKAGWQRWNDYGIANLIEGGVGRKVGNYRQAEAAFQKLLTLGVKDALPHAHLNLARTYIDEGRLEAAGKQLQLCAEVDPQHQWWTRAWLTAVVNSESGTMAHLDAAAADLERIVDPNNQPEKATRGFDFSKDYIILDLLANTYFKKSQSDALTPEAKRAVLLQAIAVAERVLTIDPEDVMAHDLLAKSYDQLGEAATLPTGVTAPPFTEVADYAKRAADAALSAQDRLLAVANVRLGLTGVGKQNSRPDKPKLVAMRELGHLLRPAFHTATDPAVREALASALAAYHRQSHMIFIPDEVARSDAAQNYRAKYPAAKYAARDRVYYPTTPEHVRIILSGGELVKE